MPRVSRFSRRRPASIPAQRASNPITNLDLRGLDLSSPYDMVQKNRAPFAKNFRLYAEQSDDRRVAVTSRKGQMRYTVPINEALSGSVTSTTGVSSSSIGTLTSWKAMPFTPTKTGRLTKIEISVKSQAGATGPIVVEIYSDNAGLPGTKLADSGILSSSITTSAAYVPAYFIEAPSVVNGTQYWIVTHIQDDGTDSYLWTSNTATTQAKNSNSSGSSWSALAYSLNYKVYVADDVIIKGLTRYAPSSSGNKTLVAIGTSVYSVNDNTGACTSIYDGVNALSTLVMFTYADDKVFWVDGYSNLMTWNGTPVSSASELAVNGTFETNITGWTAGASTTGTRDTVTFRSGVASMKLVSTGGAIAQSSYAYTYTVNKQYTVTAYVNGTVGQQVKLSASGQDSSAVTLAAGWNLVTFTFFASTASSTYGVKTVGTNQTIYIDDVSLKETGIEQITHAQLPILSRVLFHKNRLFGVTASDPNKYIWSEEPGNSDGSGNQWYKAYLSTSFGYVPVPKASDPLTAAVSFQDTLLFFTRSGKWALYGSNPGDFYVRQTVGRKGCVAQNALYADENFVYFVSTEGLERYNGSSDKLLSEMVQPEYAKIANVNKMFVTKWNRQIRFYYPYTGSPVNNRCLIWHTVFEEWMLDTDTYVSYAVPWTDGDDNYELIEASSLSPALYYAEKDYNSAGKAIDFEYDCKYDSFGSPAQRKRWPKFFPLLEGQDRNYPVSVGIDKDRANSPTYKTLLLLGGGSVVGSSTVGTAVVGGTSGFKPIPMRIPGYAYYWQVRIKRKAINNPIRFIGYTLSLRAKKL